MRIITKFMLLLDYFEKIEVFIDYFGIIIIIITISFEFSNFHFIDFIINHSIASFIIIIKKFIFLIVFALFNFNQIIIKVVVLLIILILI